MAKESKSRLSWKLLIHMTNFSILENAVDFVKGTFPEELFKSLDLDTLTLENSSYIDEELKRALLMMRNIFNEGELEGNLGKFLKTGRKYFKKEEGLKFLESTIIYLFSSTENVYTE